MSWLQWPLIVASVILQLLLISALIKGPYRRYPVVFLYALVLLFTTVMDVAAFTEVGSVAKFAMQLYKTEGLRQLLLFAVVLSFINRAMEKSPMRHNLRWALVGGALLVVAASMLVNRNIEPYSLRMTHVGRNLSFSAVVINLLLWTLLITRRSRDRELLMLTGGLGVQFTGEAIGQSLRQVSAVYRSEPLLFIGNLLYVFGHLLRLWVWWETFRKSPQPASPVAPPQQIKERPAGD